MGSYVPTTPEEQKEMLAAIGLESMSDLYQNIPAQVKLGRALEMPQGLSELETMRTMKKIAGKNIIFPSIFRGAGAYRHFIPSVVKQVIGKENFVTSYTPYQAEISQGILQAIFEFQTLICELTGMDVANASVYDGATAAAESIAMCKDKKRNKILIAQTVSPAVINVIKTYCFGNEMEVELIPEVEGRCNIDLLQEQLDDSIACVYIQQPNYYGNVEQAQEIGELIHQTKAKFIMGVNPISLGILKTPMECGADVAVGEGQPLGLSLSFGGPYIGFMACTKEMVRKLPGRIAGETKDRNGKTGYVLTLQAREQHIRREKASSNICSNQALCALGVSVYLSAMGREGLKNAATQSMSKAHYMAESLEKIGFKVKNSGLYFHEFVTESKVSTKVILKALEEKGILGGLALENNEQNQLLWCCTEMNTKEEIDLAVEILKEVMGTC